MNNTIHTIGVVGSAGDLGSQLVTLLKNTGYHVRTAANRKDTTTVAQLMDECDIVHFCIPSTGFKDIPAVKSRQVIVLHDSVMATSVHIDSDHFANKANHVHMLMNESKTVVMDELNPDNAVLKQHFAALGLNPVSMSASEHDYIMSRSQAPLALLVALLLPDLDQWQKQGVLTPSGSALLSALEARAAQWTPATIDALFANPQLEAFVNDLKHSIKKRAVNHGK